MSSLEKKNLQKFFTQADLLSLDEPSFVSHSFFDKNREETSQSLRKR